MGKKPEKEKEVNFELEAPFWELSDPDLLCEKYDTVHSKQLEKGSWKPKKPSKPRKINTVMGNNINRPPEIRRRVEIPAIEFQLLEAGKTTIEKLAQKYQVSIPTIYGKRGNYRKNIMPKEKKELT